MYLVPLSIPYQAETNLSWRITLAVSIYSDTRRISRERPTRPTFPGAPAIHLRCMSPDSARTLAHLKILRRETRLNRTDVCTSYYLPPPSLLRPYFLYSPFLPTPFGQGAIVPDRLRPRNSSPLHPLRAPFPRTVDIPRFNFQPRHALQSGFRFCFH